MDINFILISANLQNYNAINRIPMQAYFKKILINAFI